MQLGRIALGMRWLQPERNLLLESDCHFRLPGVIIIESLSSLWNGAVCV